LLVKEEKNEPERGWVLLDVPRVIDRAGKKKKKKEKGGGTSSSCSLSVRGPRAEKRKELRSTLTHPLATAAEGRKEKGKGRSSWSCPQPTKRKRERINAAKERKKRPRFSGSAASAGL